MINLKFWKCWRGSNTPVVSTPVTTLTIKLQRGGEVYGYSWSQPIDVGAQVWMGAEENAPLWWTAASSQWHSVYEWFFDNTCQWHIVHHNGGEIIINRADVVTINVYQPPSGV